MKKKDKKQKVKELLDKAIEHEEFMIGVFDVENWDWNCRKAMEVSDDLRTVRKLLGYDDDDDTQQQ